MTVLAVAVANIGIAFAAVLVKGLGKIIDKAEE